MPQETRVHRVRGIGFSSYLIETANRLFLVDTGFPGFETLVTRRIAALGRHVRELALVLADAELYHGERGEYPVLLLDDVASELDARSPASENARHLDTIFLGPAFVVDRPEGE